jgi:type I restriction enzyme S subunit
MKFNFISIGEIADVTKLAGFEFTKHIKYNDTGEIIALRALNLRNGVLDLTDIKRIDKAVSEKLPRSKLFVNDILLTYTGNGYGDCAIIEEDNKYHLAPNICKITPNMHLVNPYFLYSVIRSDYFYQQMTNYIGGSSQPTIPMKTIRMLKVPFPNIEIQNSIASILYAINNKIALNTAINENLRCQAA